MLDDDMKMLMPIIRKHLPTIFAEQVVGIQPMSVSAKMLPPWQIAEDHVVQVPKGYVVIDANREISKWIEEQPLYMWKHGSMVYAVGFWDRYIVSDKLLTWLKLRWQ